MNAKQLAEFMLDEEVYKPEADAHSIAKSYVELAEITEKMLAQMDGSGGINVRLLKRARSHLDYDPAKQ
jgi:hypothetical protein